MLAADARAREPGGERGSRQPRPREPRRGRPAAGDRRASGEGGLWAQLSDPLREAADLRIAAPVAVAGRARAPAPEPVVAGRAAPAAPRARAARGHRRSRARHRAGRRGSSEDDLPLRLNRASDRGAGRGLDPAPASTDPPRGVCTFRSGGSVEILNAPASRSAQIARGRGRRRDALVDSARRRDQGRDMAARVGINGFGRIGRNFFRAAVQRDADFEIVAANDLGDVKTMAHLLEYDSMLGRLAAVSRPATGASRAAGRELKLLSERDPAALPWGDLGVDVVLESTGFFTKREQARSAPRRGRAEGRDLRAGDRPGRDARARRQRRRLRPRERTASSPTRRARRTASRRSRRCCTTASAIERGLHDDDPRVHERPAHPRPPARGPAPRSRGRDQPHPHLDRRGARDRPRAPGPEGEARRHGDSRPGPDRLDRRPRRAGRAASRARTR